MECQLSAIECRFKIHNILQYFNPYNSDGCVNDESSDDSDVKEGKNHAGDSTIEATPALHRQRQLLIPSLTSSSSLASEASNSTSHEFEGPTAASNSNTKPKSNVSLPSLHINCQTVHCTVQRAVQEAEQSGNLHTS